MVKGHRRTKGQRSGYRQAALFLGTQLLVGVGAAQGIASGNTALGYPAVANGRDLNGAPMVRNQGGGSGSTPPLWKRHGELLQAEQRRLMVGEAQRILAVATDLSMSMGRQAGASATVDEDAWRRAEAIERLARNVRLRMLGAH